MKNLRRWQINSTKPFSLQLAADARLSRTDYLDDQVWELLPGAVDSPALALQTHYGGRAGLASLVPMWLYEGRIIYQAQAYAVPPVITTFAPGYMGAEGKLTPALSLQADYWAMDSHAVGARFTLRNASAKPETLRLDLFGHVASENKEQKLGIISLREGYNALYMGQIGSLEPVVVLENGKASVVEGEAVSPKIGADLTVPARGEVSLRWVHAGLLAMRDSLALAQSWLKQDWTAHFNVIDRAAQAIPMIETGRSDWDMVIASAYQQLVQAFLKPTGSLPYGSFVATRQSWQGFSPRGDGTDHHRAWSGQDAPLAYLAALGIAPVDAQFAQGIVRNYLAVQADDGWIDSRPGLAGQRQGMICAPILARLSWNVYQYSEDKAFLSDVFPGLLKFFNRWFQADLDADGDGIPEWQNERQTGYVFFPTFAAGQIWGQNADIRTVETPDLTAYLLSEAISLRETARTIGDKKALKDLDKRVTGLQNALESLWRDGRYTYRDRDTHTTTGSVVIIKDGRGDEEHLPALPLNPPNRLIVRVVGGVSHVPNIRLRLEGLNQSGSKIVEEVDPKAFVWGTGRGVYTTQRVFSQIDRIRPEGLSRVYHITVETVDTTRLDINALLPLWSTGISQERADALIKLLTDKKHFWRTNGVTMCSAQDPNFSPSNADGGGGLWLYWLTLIAEGLIDSGHPKRAADLLERLLTFQTEILAQQKRFFEFYHSDEAHGLGERGHLAGIVPLHLLLRVIGVRIISSGKVWTGGSFLLDKAVTVTQHGVIVKRGKNSTQIRFPSGHTVELKNEAGWQAVIDPKPAILPPVEPISAPPESVSKSGKTTRPSSKSVIIEVQHEPEE